MHHAFHDEVDEYRRHWWRCDGPCQLRKPFYGYVKRATNRAPSAHDPWWAEHQKSCGGTYVKVKEPESYSQKRKGKAGGTGERRGREAPGPGAGVDRQALLRGRGAVAVPRPRVTRSLGSRRQKGGQSEGRGWENNARNGRPHDAPSCGPRPGGPWPRAFPRGGWGRGVTRVRQLHRSVSRAGSGVVPGRGHQVAAVTAAALGTP